jgi:hypothetical protein
MNVRLLFYLFALALAGDAANASVPPQRTGDCAWVHGRFAVYNGSSVQRIWIVGTRRIVAIPDDDPAPLPATLAAFEKDPKGTVGGELRGDFHICALEVSLPGHMQHVRVDAVRRARYRGRPFPPGADAPAP